MWAVALALQASAAVPYWRDPRVHNLGNAGIGGGIHAAMAPLATHVIDRIAYGGVDVRKRVLAEHTRPGDDVVDFGCGTGFSTAASCTGVDTSAEMLWIAQRVHPRKTFVSGNAETWGLPASKDVVTVMFVLHEVPQLARRRILRNAAQVAKDKVVVADIIPTYAPSNTMLMGEPFVLEYLEHIDEDVAIVAEQTGRRVVVEDLLGRVRTWVLHHPTPPRTGRRAPARRR